MTGQGVAVTDIAGGIEVPDPSGNRVKVIVA